MLPVGPVDDGDSISKDINMIVDASQELVLYVRGVIEGVEIQILVDSGSIVSLMSANFRMSIPTLRNRPLKKDYVSARAVNGQMLDTLGTSESVVAVKVCTPNAAHLVSDFVGYLEPNVADSDKSSGFESYWTGHFIETRYAPG